VLQWGSTHACAVNVVMVISRDQAKARAQSTTFGAGRLDSQPADYYYRAAVVLDLQPKYREEVFVPGRQGNRQWRTKIPLAGAPTSLETAPRSIYVPKPLSREIRVHR
jgi:hypothetical protein